MTNSEKTMIDEKEAIKAHAGLVYFKLQGFLEQFEVDSAIDAVIGSAMSATLIAFGKQLKELKENGEEGVSGEQLASICINALRSVANDIERHTERNERR